MRFSFCPHPVTVIRMNYEYLEKAKIALKEAGGEYVPSARDLTNELFDRDLGQMISLSFRKHILFSLNM